MAYVQGKEGTFYYAGQVFDISKWEATLAPCSVTVEWYNQPELFPGWLMVELWEEVLRLIDEPYSLTVYLKEINRRLSDV